MTVFCYLESNANKWMITPPKQSQMLYSVLILNQTVVTMLLCMLYAIITDEGGAYTPQVASSFALFYVKFPCAVALHFVLYPQVGKGMKIMKFANNQCDMFVPGGAEISYTIGLIQVMTALLCEGINIVMLSYQHYVSHAIIHFVALEVIIEVSTMYLESLMDNPLQ
jgi:hypothetical protein